MATAQRGHYAGVSRPSGYKDRFSPNNLNTADTQVVDRFGGNGSTNNNGVTTTTQRLPHGAQGDVFAFNRLSQLPLDRQPFWLINYQAIEAQKGTPDAFPTRVGGTQQAAGQFNTVQNPIPINNNNNQQQNGQNGLFNPNPQFNPNAQNNQFNPNPQFNPTVQNNRFNPNLNSQQNTPVRIDAGQQAPQLNSELNINNYGFGIPQGTQGHYAGK